MKYAVALWRTDDGILEFKEYISFRKLKIIIQFTGLKINGR